MEPTTTTKTTTPAPTISNERLAKLLALRARLLEKGVANPFDNLSEYFKWQNEIDDHLKTGQSGWATGRADGQTDGQIDRSIYRLMDAWTSDDADDIVILTFIVYVHLRWFQLSYGTECFQIISYSIK